MDELKWLSFSLRNQAMSYKGYIINQQGFYIREVEMSTQNSGVSIKATTICRASVKDIPQVVDVVSYNGVIREIILFDYHKFHSPISKCDWVNKGHGLRIKDDFTVVNLHQSQNQYEREPFYSCIISKTSILFERK